MERTDNENSMVEGPPAILKSSCLLCGSRSLTMVKIFTKEGLFSDLGHKINLYLPVEVQPGDGQPEQCCTNCTYTIMSWHKLYLACLKKQKLYQKILDDSALEQPEVYVEPDGATEKHLDLEESIQQVKEEPQSNESSEEMSEDDDEEAFLMKFEEENQDDFMETLEDSDNDVEETEQDQEKVPCTFCEAVFEKKSSMRLHVLQDHPDERPFPCETCGKRFKKNKHLQFHLPLHSDLRPFKCKVCLKAFKWKGSLKLHLKVHLEKNAFDCKLCDKKCAHKSSWLWHVQQRHKMTEQEYEDLSPETAQLMRRSAAALKEAKGTEKFTCKICNKTLSAKRSLTAHIKGVHENVKLRKKFPCNICGLQFERSYLKDHLTKHSDERPFSCENCGKCFKLRKSLAQHMLTHSKIT